MKEQRIILPEAGNVLKEEDIFWLISGNKLQEDETILLEAGTELKEDESDLKILGSLTIYVESFRKNGEPTDWVIFIYKPGKE